MSFTRIHTAETTIDGQTLWLGVYIDGSANFFVDNAWRNTIASDATSHNLKEPKNIRDWINAELTTGRAKR